MRKLRNASRRRLERLVRQQTGLWFETKKLFDVLSKSFVNFIVTWNGLFLTRNWIDLNVVTTTMAMKHTALLFQLPNELTTFQRAISLV